MWTDEHANSLRAVFEALNDSGLRWMVLRNHAGLPEINRGKDVDLAVSYTDFAKASATIEQALKARGFTHRSHVEFQSLSCSTYFNVSGPAAISIKIDLVAGFVWRGATVVSFSQLFRQSEVCGQMRVPGMLIDGFLLWIKPLLTGGAIKTRYIEDVFRAYDSDPVRFEELATAAFGSTAAKRAMSHFASRRLELTIPMKSSLRRAAWLRSSARDPCRCLSQLSQHVWLELLRRSVRPGLSLFAVLGPDGSGKSTFIESLTLRLADILVKDSASVAVQHFRPNIVPNIKELVSGKPMAAEQFTSPHRAQPAGKVSSLIRISYYCADYVLGYWLKIRKACVAGSVVIFDRYVYDFVVDPRRTRLSLPRSVRLAVARIAPSPDVVIVLECDAETIFGRKQELTLSEIGRQLGEYRLLDRSIGNCIYVHSGAPVNSMCEEAVRKMVQVGCSRF